MTLVRIKPQTTRHIEARYIWTTLVRRQYGSHIAWDIYQWNLYKGQWEKAPGHSGHINVDTAKREAEAMSTRAQTMLSTGDRFPPLLKLIDNPYKL